MQPLVCRDFSFDERPIVRNLNDHERMVKDGERKKVRTSLRLIYARTREYGIQGSNEDPFKCMHLCPTYLVCMTIQRYSQWQGGWP
eukprot:7617893-Ditylum_brightwellii.AAC.1